MGGGSTSSTSSSLPSVPPEFKPLVTQSVNQLIAAQNQNPLTQYSQALPLQIAPESSYTQQGYTLLPQMLGPLPSQAPWVGMQPQIQQTIQGLNELAFNPRFRNPYL